MFISIVHAPRRFVFDAWTKKYNPRSFTLGFIQYYKTVVSWLSPKLEIGNVAQCQGRLTHCSSLFNSFPLISSHLSLFYFILLSPEDPFLKNSQQLPTFSHQGITFWIKICQNFKLLSFQRMTNLFLVIISNQMPHRF